MKLSEQLKQLSKKQKIVIISVISLAVIGGSIGYKAYADVQHQQKVEQALVLLSEKDSDLKALYKKSEDLYSKDKSDFLNKETTEESVTSLENELEKIVEKYKNVTFPEGVESEDSLNYQEMNKELLSQAQTMLATQKVVNSLFGKIVIEGDAVSKDVAIKDDLKNDFIKSAKDSYYNEETKSEWQKSINNLLDSAEGQLNQITKAKQAVEKVFKDGKVTSTDQKAYDTAKAEVDKVKNEKAKKSLSENLTKVKTDIDKKAKEAEEKKKQEEQQVTEVEQDSSVTVAQDGVSTGADSVTVNGDQGVNNADSASTTYPNVDYGSNNSSSNAGTGATGGGSSAGNGSSGGSQTGGNQGGGTPTQPVQPTEPEVPSGPPAGWIVPPYPIGSGELVDWLADQGYSGYDSSGGYIRPY